MNSHIIIYNVHNVTWNEKEMKQRFNQSTVQSTQNYNTLTFARLDSFHLCLMVKMTDRNT